MPRPRPQFRLSTLLWITLAVATFFGGTVWSGEYPDMPRELGFNSRSESVGKPAIQSDRVRMTAIFKGDGNSMFVQRVERLLQVPGSAVVASRQTEGEEHAGILPEDLDE